MYWDDVDACATTPQGCEERGLDPATHFAFEHKIFTVEGAKFLLSGSEKEPSMKVNVGEYDAVIPIDQICDEFSIDKESTDGKLLETVKKGLLYVRDIRPGDTIPRELLDGSASWSIDDKHRSFARNKLIVNVSNWAGKKPPTPLTPDRAAKLAEDKEVKTVYEKGVHDISQKTSATVGSIRSNIDKISRELAYIEALGDRYQLARKIMEKLNVIQKGYEKDQQRKGEVERIKFLMEPPITGFIKVFREVEGISSDPVSMAGNITDTIAFVREKRDELHRAMMVWDEIIEVWDIDISQRTKEVRQAMDFTYRFVATHFPQNQDWM
ncbi:MAG: hypothetical protein HOH65_18195 [Rhodospirillaceae bacterium]|nr:hypothetical protein [Rhodospirillaceae bacterium]